jgi:hypothetical protein
MRIPVAKQIVAKRAGAASVVKGCHENRAELRWVRGEEAEMVAVAMRAFTAAPAQGYFSESIATLSRWKVCGNRSTMRKDLR